MAKSIRRSSRSETKRIQRLQQFRPLTVVRHGIVVEPALGRKRRLKSANLIGFPRSGWRAAARNLKSRQINMRFQILWIALRRLFKVYTGLFEISEKEIRASQHQEIEIPRCRIEAHGRAHQRYGRGRLSGKCLDTRH